MRLISFLFISLIMASSVSAFNHLGLNKATIMYTVEFESDVEAIMHTLKESFNEIHEVTINLKDENATPITIQGTEYQVSTYKVSFIAELPVVCDNVMVLKEEGQAVGLFQINAVTVSKTMINSIAIRADLQRFFDEDDLSRNSFYNQSLPNDLVDCSLKIKSDLILAGLPWFIESFRYLGADLLDDLLEWEKKSLKKGEEINFKLPFSLALTGERIALNLLQHASSIATYTQKYVEKAEKFQIAILDTRKTTPGLRAIEKYAVRCGGGYNHRLGQTDMWMVKDNHKSFFGGVKEAVEFFKSQQGFYTPIEVEIHDLGELELVKKLGVRHLMLDNFSREEIQEAVKMKSADMTYEVSGGVRLDTIDDYLMEGIDAISIGALTYGAPPVDISLKFQRS